MSFVNRWSAFAARLGTSPRQLAILVASAAVAIGIFGGKIFFTPKSAAATAVLPVAAPATKIAAPAPNVIPEIFLQPIPRWNLATTPARSPFTSPDDLKPAIDTTTQVAGQTAEPLKSSLVLQATMDRSFAVVNGKTLRIGQSWTDTKTGQIFQLVNVGERNAQFLVGSQMLELSLDQ